MPMEPLHRTYVLHSIRIGADVPPIVYESVFMTDVAESTKHHVCLYVDDAYLMILGEVRSGWNLNFLLHSGNLFSE